jgi:hypothetical protein
MKKMVFTAEGISFVDDNPFKMKAVKIEDAIKDISGKVDQYFTDPDMKPIYFYHITERGNDILKGIIHRIITRKELTYDTLRLLNLASRNAFYIEFNKKILDSETRKIVDSIFNDYYGVTNIKNMDLHDTLIGLQYLIHVFNIDCSSIDILDLFEEND